MNFVHTLSATVPDFDLPLKGNDESGTNGGLAKSQVAAQTERGGGRMGGQKN